MNTPPTAHKSATDFSLRLGIPLLLVVMMLLTLIMNAGFLVVALTLGAGYVVTYPYRHYSTFCFWRRWQKAH